MSSPIPGLSAVPMTPNILGLGVGLKAVDPVLTAPIDTILYNDDSLPIEIMTDLIFENIGGQELINIARNDTVNGQTIIYQPIKNLTEGSRRRYWSRWRTRIY